jgi:cytoskeletal protein CcmA (bactofilin family)
MWSKSAEGKESPQAPQIAAPDPISPKQAPLSGFSAPPVAVIPSAAQVPGAGSTISTGLRIHGEVTGNADLFIDGEAQGSIRLGQSKVSVGRQGHVQADIEAREIVIEGRVHGNLKASESIRLGPGSHVQGSLMTPRVAIEDGARLRGKVETTRVGELKRSAAAGQAKSAEAPPATSVSTTKE